jgi:uncharacterized protein YjbJ (UPF0337 family)
MASIVDLVRPKAALIPKPSLCFVRSFSSATAPGPAANNKRICKVVGTLPASSRCMDKEGREASRAYMTERIATMDEDRISGTARNAGGKIEEGVGRLTGDARTQIQGKLDQAAGAAQDLYGQTADTARDTAATFDKWLRRTIETQPYTAAIVALGIGWLLGRMHRPL